MKAARNGDGRLEPPMPKGARLAIMHSTVILVSLMALYAHMADMKTERLRLKAEADPIVRRECNTE